MRWCSELKLILRIKDLRMICKKKLRFWRKNFDRIMSNERLCACKLYLILIYNNYDAWTWCIFNNSSKLWKNYIFYDCRNESLILFASKISNLNEFILIVSIRDVIVSFLKMQLIVFCDDWNNFELKRCKLVNYQSF